LIETILLMLVGATAPPPTAEPRLLNPQEVITDLDYPDEAMRRLEEGRVRALVRVGPAGSARECEIEQSSGSQSLDRQTCVLIKKRGRFDPAPAGTSDVRVAHVALRWTMPEKPWIRLSGWFSREQMRVEPSGAISSCTWRSSEGETGKCTPSIAFTPDLASRFAAMAGASPTGSDLRKPVRAGWRKSAGRASSDNLQTARPSNCGQQRRQRWAMRSDRVFRRKACARALHGGATKDVPRVRPRGLHLRSLQQYDLRREGGRSIEPLSEIQPINLRP
jgi:TonB family protein